MSSNVLNFEFLTESFWQLEEWVLLAFSFIEESLNNFPKLLILKISEAGSHLDSLTLEMMLFIIVLVLVCELEWQYWKSQKRLEACWGYMENL